ncbi:hypothetical protein [Amycolatopsis sp. cmx-4-61]|uniref:hypothetical protein n=1 Tax=Amycolatopsis sp. cmx-4-61 TaxID=2790937 RepID=UPI00397B2FE8
MRHGMTTHGPVRPPAGVRRLNPLANGSTELITRIDQLLLAGHHPLVRQCGGKIGMTSRFMRFRARPDAEVERLAEGSRGVDRLGDGRHTPAIELVSHAREPERPIS